MKTKIQKLMPYVGVGIMVGSLVGEIPFWKLIVFAMGLGLVVGGVIQGCSDGRKKGE